MHPLGASHVISLQNSLKVPLRACPPPLHGQTSIDTPSPAVCLLLIHTIRIIHSSTTPLILAPQIILSRKMCLIR